MQRPHAVGAQPDHEGDQPEEQHLQAHVATVPVEELRAAAATNIT